MYFLLIKHKLNTHFYDHLATPTWLLFEAPALVLECLMTSRSSSSSMRSRRASGAQTAHFNSFEIKKHCKMVRQEKSNNEMKNAATNQASSSTKNTGTNGCWIT